jgi:cytochrome c biogenesis protein CcdA
VLCCAVLQVPQQRPGRKSYSLRASSKALVQQYFFMSQLATVFSFVSPMITYFALNITNFWVKLNIIVGAVLIFIYIIMCGFHRKLMAPSKQRPGTP